MFGISPLSMMFAIGFFFSLNIWLFAVRFWLGYGNWLLFWDQLFLPRVTERFRQAGSPRRGLLWPWHIVPASRHPIWCAKWSPKGVCCPLQGVHPQAQRQERPSESHVGWHLLLTEEFLIDDAQLKVPACPCTPRRWLLIRDSSPAGEQSPHGQCSFRAHTLPSEISRTWAEDCRALKLWPPSLSAQGLLHRLEP